MPTHFRAYLLDYGAALTAFGGSNECSDVIRCLDGDQSVQLMDRLAVTTADAVAKS